MLRRAPAATPRASAVSRSRSRRGTPRRIAFMRESLRVAGRRQTSARHSAPLSYFPVDPAYRDPGRAPAGARAVRRSRCRPPRDNAARCAASARSRFTLNGQPLSLGRVRRGGREGHAPPVRAVRRPHERHRNLPGRTLPRSRADGDGHLRSGLQPRVSTRSACSTRPTTARIPPPESRLKVPIRVGERLTAPAMRLHGRRLQHEDKGTKSQIKSFLVP